MSVTGAGGPADGGWTAHTWLTMADGPEQELADEVQFGGEVDAAGEQVRAEVLFQILTGAGGDSGRFFRALRLRDAKIVGQLDLSSATVLGPAHFTQCRFTERLVLDKASTRSLTLDRCQMEGGLAGDSVRIDGDLRLNGTRFGPLNGKPGPAIDLDQAVITGSLYCKEGFHAQGAVVLRLGKVGGQVELTGARFHNPSGPFALCLDRTAMGGLFCRQGFRADGEVRLIGAQVTGQVGLAGATFHNPGGDALCMDRARITGGLFCGDGFYANGEVRLPEADVSGQVSLGGGTFYNPGGDALSMDQARISGGLFCRDRFLAYGKVRLIGAQIMGQLDLSGGTFHNPGRDALSLNQATVSGRLFCGERFHAAGKVSLLGTQIADSVELTGGTFHNPGGVALSLDRARIAGGLSCNRGFRAEGTVTLRYARVGAVDLSGGEFHSSGPDEALSLGGAEIADSLVMSDVVADGVDLRDARTRLLTLTTGDPQGSEPATRLSGFYYARIEPHPGDPHWGSVLGRRAWLARDPDAFVPGPYTVLSDAYAAGGHEQAARMIRIASQDHRYRHARSHGPGWRRVTAGVWGQLKRWTVGYGYQPAIAIVCLLGYWTVGSLVLLAVWDRFTGTEQTGSFVYFLDALVPFLDLPQNGDVTASGPVVWLVIALVALGWVLVSAALAGITGSLIRRD